MPENRRSIPQIKRAALLLLWIVLLMALFWGYERLMYPLDRNADLSAYAAEYRGVDCAELDRAEARGVTVLLLDTGDSDKNLAAAFPRSLLFSRYGKEAAFLALPKDSIRVFLCHFHPELPLRDVWLEDGDDAGVDFSGMYYFFNTWHDPDTVEFSVINGRGFQNSVLTVQLIPYGALALLTAVLLWGVHLAGLQVERKSGSSKGQARP